MKKISCILCIISSLVFSKIKAQVFIDTLKTWNVMDCTYGFGGETCHTTTYKFGLDTLINSKKYYKLHITDDEYPQNWASYSYYLVSEDTLTQKVYFRIDGEDVLMYDFSLEVGDTAFVPGVYFQACPSRTMIVDSIKINTYYGVPRKQWYFNSHLGSSESWIEGIGNLYGLTNHSIWDCSVDYESELLCYKEKDSLRYEGGLGTCYFSNLGIVESKVVSLCQILFNPIENEFEIITANDFPKIISLKDEIGKTIFSITSNEQKIKLNIANKGIYFITVVQQTSIWADKLIKF